MKKTDIVFCAVTNSVLYAGDALFDGDGNAYRVECAPEGAKAGVFDDDDEPAGEPAEPTDLISVAVDITPGDEAAADDEAGEVDPDADDEPAGEDYPSARHNGRRHNPRGDR